MGLPAEGFAAWLNSIQDPTGPAAGVRGNIAGKSSYIPGMIAAGWLVKKGAKVDRGVKLFGRVLSRRVVGGNRYVRAFSAGFGFQHHNASNIRHRMLFATARRRAWGCQNISMVFTCRPLWRPPAGRTPGISLQKAADIHHREGPVPRRSRSFPGRVRGLTEQHPPRSLPTARRLENFRRQRSDACLSGTPVRQCRRFVRFGRPVDGVGAATAQVIISAPAGDTFHRGGRGPSGPANLKAAVIKGAGNVFLTVTAALIAYQGDTGLFCIF